TTVSEITASECEHLLGRIPEVVLPNGLGTPFPEPGSAGEEAVAGGRRRLLSLAELVTGDSYDPSSTRVVLSVGPYEYTNKGVDVYLGALARLKERLEGRRDFRVVAFASFPSDHLGPRRALQSALSGHRTGEGPFLCTHDLRDESRD